MLSSNSGKMRCLIGCAEREKQPLQKTKFSAKSKFQLNVLIKSLGVKRLRWIYFTHKIHRY